MNLSVYHVLMIVLVAFALHYLMGNCGCRRVEGVTVHQSRGMLDAFIPRIRDRREGDCCNMGECGDGLECNLTAMTSSCMTDPGNTWYGVCEKLPRMVRPLVDGWRMVARGDLGDIIDK